MKRKIVQMLRSSLVLWIALAMVLLFLSCAPGNDRWDQELSPGNWAGFWAGIWHGLIVIITFIVSLFTREVSIYEVNNTGWPYNLGFLLGLCFSVAAPWRMKPWKWSKKRRLREHEWREIGDKIEERVREGLRSWLGEGKEERREEWEEVAGKIEEKIKKVLREWAEK